MGLFSKGGAPCFVVSRSVSLSVVLLSSAVENARGEAMYTITDLGGGGAAGINASGQVVGQNAVDHAFLYSNGVMTDLRSLWRH